MYIVHLKYKRFKRDTRFMYPPPLSTVTLINGNVLSNDVPSISLACFFSERGEIVKNISLNLGLP